jgi:hypothetical protein
MHDLDRTLLEFSEDADIYEQDEYGSDGMPASHWQDEAEWQDADAVFDELEEMELAAQLLEVTDDDDMDQFLGKLVRKAGKAVGRSVRGPVGRALGNTLRNVARRALPVAGAALGNLVAPGAGGAVGSRLASSAGQLFGLELEGLSPEDAEFEVARRVVRLAGDATRQAADAADDESADDIAKNAVVVAAQQHAPGLAQAVAANGASAGPARTHRGMSRGGGRSGRWVRQGDRIILFGITG